MGVSARDIIPLSHARANFSELAEEVKAGMGCDLQAMNTAQAKLPE